MTPQQKLKDIEIKFKNDSYSNDMKWLISRIKVLEAACEFYSDEGNYTHDDLGNEMATAWSNNTCGEKARKALAGNK